MHQVFVDDLLDVLQFHKAVPDCLWIDDHHRAMLALIQAAGLVRPDRVLQAGGLYSILQGIFQLATAAGAAARPSSALQALIAANKNMTFKLCHALSVFQCVQSCFFETIPFVAMQTDNLISLKDDMIAFIAGHGMHRMNAYVHEDIPTVVFEEENADSWKDFVEHAKAAGVSFLTMSEVTLEKRDIEILIEQLRAREFPDSDDTPDIDDAQYLVNYVGKTGYLQLGFAYNGIMFIYETSTEWYDRFQQLMESVSDFDSIIVDDPDADE